LADEIDIANDDVQKKLDATLKTIDTNITKNNTGKCIWCGKEVKDKRRWCSAECRDEHTLYANKI
jgi:hypothetical protein